MAGRAGFFHGLLQAYQAPVMFDAVTSVFASHSIPDLDGKFAYFRSLDARLKPGGVLVLADLFGDKGSFEFGRLSKAWVTHLVTQGISAEAFDQVRAYVESEVDFVTEDELTAILLGAGFYGPVRFFQSFLFGGWASRKFD